MYRFGLLTFLAFVLSTPAFAVTIYKYTDENGVVTYTDKVTKGAQIFVFNDRMVERLDKDVRLETKRHKAGETLIVRNDLFAPVEIQLSLNDLVNVSGAPSKPISWVLQPRTAIRLVTLAPTDPAQKMTYKPKLRYALGDPRMRPSTSLYDLAWKGGPFRLTQGANGRYSHFTPKGRYALDIAMPVGTPIVAARSGVVIKTENSQTGRGTNPSGNFIRVLHDDGTMGVYLHLQKGSVSVAEGQYVERGSYIAKSGNTGNSTGPHLHFVVQRNIGLAVESIPFDFNQPIDSLPNFAVGGD